MTMPTIEITERGEEREAEFHDFVEREVMPVADAYDLAGQIPGDLIASVRRRGYFGMLVQERHGGGGADMVTYGLLHEEIGRGCSSLRSLLTVHTMVAHAVRRWGGESLCRSVLPVLASGEVLAAFCLTEANAGSDAANIAATAEAVAGGFLLNGHKKWVTGAQIAGFFLVFAKVQGQASAFLVDRHNLNIEVTPIDGMLGTRASMMADVGFEQCFVPQERQIGAPGFGLSHIAATALDLGRYSVACGCVGISQACVDASARHAGGRIQFGRLLTEHPLVQKMLTEAIVKTQAARLMCRRAGSLRDLEHPSAIAQTAMAKYFASRAAAEIASDAVQIHGASGCAPGAAVSRYYRDAKVMEIVEGSSQILEGLIASAATPLTLASQRN